MLAESRGQRVVGLAPPASAANTLEQESGITFETLQRFLARYAGVIECSGTSRGMLRWFSRLQERRFVLSDCRVSTDTEFEQTIFDPWNRFECYLDFRE